MLTFRILIVFYSAITVLTVIILFSIFNKTYTYIPPLG